jgi:hypothetical protein
MKSPTNLNQQRAIHDLFCKLLKRHGVEIFLPTTIESIRRACGKCRPQIRICFCHPQGLPSRRTTQSPTNKLKDLVNSVKMAFNPLHGGSVADNNMVDTAGAEQLLSFRSPRSGQNSQCLNLHNRSSRQPNGNGPTADK